MKKRWMTKLMPSMYQRRLLLIVVGIMGMFTLPLMQVASLTVVKGEELREQAESKLRNTLWINTVRGAILDRKGRVLAQDRASFDVTVDYEVLSGKWAYTQAARKARATNGKWNELAPEQREELISEQLPEFMGKLEKMYDTISAVSGVPRNEIDERRSAIIEQVQYLSATITEANRRAMERELNKGEELVTEGGQPREKIEVKTADVKKKIAEEEAAHTLLPDVSDAVGFKIRQLTEGAFSEAGSRREGLQLPGVHVRDSVVREYPLETMDVPIDLGKLPGMLRGSGTKQVRVEGVGTHLIGYVRERAYDQDIARRYVEVLRRAGKEPPVLPGVKASRSEWVEVLKELGRQVRGLSEGGDRGRYLPGDAVGAYGVEYANEFELRGERGVQTRHLDSGDIDVVEPKSGKPITLTIDAMLEARIQALYEPEVGLAVAQPWHQVRHDDEEDFSKPQDLPLGTQLNGAAVVIDVRSGDILAMVSMPSFTRSDLKRRGKEFFEDRYGTPMINRSTNKWYTPGSIVKPLMLCAAVTAGKLGHGESVDCTGHFFPDKPTIFRCWIYKNPQLRTTHTAKFGHPPDGVEAIASSCNIFFFEMGKRLGTREIVEWYTKFGLGTKAERWNLGIGQESPGSLAADAGKLDISEAILMGIGQGPVAWTPLHAADAYATLARGGVRIVPRIRIGAPVRKQDLRLDQYAVQMALDGLHGSANTPIGTTYMVKLPQADGEWKNERIFNAPGINVWAKSGTADVAPFKADFGQPGGAAVYDGDHAWTVCLAGVGRPEYAIAVVVDHGGSGGKCAGPIANQIVYALIAEGYLPDLSEKKGEEEKEEE